MATSAQPNLEGVPETMLWTLHNRASEARRPDGVIDDPQCVRIYDAIDYDYARSFGRANPSHGVRARSFDDAIRSYVEAHPGAWVVNLGEGLETQRYRLADLDATWVTVDVAEAIEVRERFIPPDERHIHVKCSVLDPRWLEHIDGERVVVTAQGLLMYLPPDHFDPLLRQLGGRFPGGRFVFDTIPPWLSKRTETSGWKLTPHYTAPPMPFGISRSELPERVRRVIPGARIEELRYSDPRGVMRVLGPVLFRLPVIRDLLPSMWTVDLP